MILKGAIELKNNEFYFNDTKCILINPRKEILNRILITDYKYNDNILEIESYTTDFKDLQYPYYPTSGDLISTRTENVENSQDYIPLIDSMSETKLDTTIQVKNEKLVLIGKVITKSNLLKSKGTHLYVLKLLVLTASKSHDLTITCTNTLDYHFIQVNKFYQFNNLTPSKIKFVKKHKTLIFDQDSTIRDASGIINTDITRLLNNTFNDTLAFNNTVVDITAEERDHNDLVSYECEITGFIMEGIFEIDSQFKLAINQKMYLGIGAVVELLNVHFYNDYFVCCLQSTINIKKYGKMQYYLPLKCSFYDYYRIALLREHLASLLLLGNIDEKLKGQIANTRLAKMIDGYIDIIHQRKKVSPNYDSMLNHEECNFIKKVELSTTVRKTKGYFVCILDYDAQGRLAAKDQYGSLRCINNLERGLVCITEMEVIDDCINVISLTYLHRMGIENKENHPPGDLKDGEYYFVPTLIPQTVLKYVFTKHRKVEKQPVITVEGLLNKQKCFIQMKANVFDCYSEYILHIPKKYIKQFGNEYAISWDDSITIRKSGKKYPQAKFKNYIDIRNHQLVNVCGKIIDKELYLDDLQVHINSDLLLDGFYMYLKNLYVYYDHTGVYGEILQSTEVNITRSFEAEQKLYGCTFMCNILAGGENGWLSCDIIRILDATDTLTVTVHDGTMEFIVVFNNSQFKSMTSETDKERLLECIPTRLEILIYGFANSVCYDTFSPNSTSVEKIEMLRTRTFKSFENNIHSVLTIKNIKVYCRKFRVVDPVLSSNLILSRLEKDLILPVLPQM
ncbi:hypothetical protein HDV01_006978 [Terramyces sp. JEL0728]|nr:hypothetical protein HDV01_006978 [Terramyces sp. JEL0728]